MDEYRLIARGAVNPLVIFNQFIGASIDDVDERSCNKAARIFPVNTLVLRLVYTPSVAEFYMDPGDCKDYYMENARPLNWKLSN